MGKAASNKKTLLTSKLDLNLTKELVKCYIWSIALYSLDTQKSRSEILESFEMWCWKRIKISWTVRVKNKVLQRVQEERNIRQKRTANQIGHILRRNSLLKPDIEGKIDVKGRRGRRRTQPLNDHMETRGYWKLEELDRTRRRTRSVRGYGPVVKRHKQALITS